MLLGIRLFLVVVGVYSLLACQNEAKDVNPRVLNFEGDISDPTKNYIVTEDINLQACINSATNTKDRSPVDSNGDGRISEAESKSLTSLDCTTFGGIKSFEGIELLTELEYLNCSANQLGAMPKFHKLENLKQLRCVNNFFTDADCAELQKVKAMGLETLEIEKQRDGRILKCGQIELVGRVKTKTPSKIEIGWRNNALNDVWGFTHREEDYIVYGSITHIHIVKLNPTEPYYETVAEIPRGKLSDSLGADVNHSIWGEFRYYAQKDEQGRLKAYLYGSTEGNWNKIDTENKHFPNLLIVDITNIKAPKIIEQTKVDPGLRSIHNITLDAQRGLLLAFGGTDHEGPLRENGWSPAWRGARIYDIKSNPEKPLYLTTVSNLYVHDGQIKSEFNEQGKLVSSKLYLAQGTTAIHWDANRTTNKENCLSVYDIKDIRLTPHSAADEEASRRPSKEHYITCKSQVGKTEALSGAKKLMGQRYPFGYAHNIWVTDDNSHIIVTGESTMDDQLSFWQLVDQPNGLLIAEFRNGLNLQGGALAHNAFVLKNHIYISHYSKGVQIAEIYKSGDNKKYIRLKWAYDTYPMNNIGGFEGCWGVFPFGKNKAYFAATDMANGLYIFKKSKAFMLEEGSLSE